MMLPTDDSQERSPAGALDGPADRRPARKFVKPLVSRLRELMDEEPNDQRNQSWNDCGSEEEQ